MRICVIFFFLAFIPFVLLAQTVSLDEQQRVIAALDSADDSVRLGALQEILENDISGALPKIEENFWKENVVCQKLSLMAMKSFNSPNLHAFAKAFFDSAEALAANPLAFSSVLSLKVEATYYLQQTGDYSTTSYVFDLLRRSSSTTRASAQNALKGILEHVPSYADSAEQELVKITKEDPFWFSRVRALDDLVDVLGAQMFPEVVTMAVDDSAPSEVVRMHALDLLFKMNYPGLHDLLQDRLSKEPSASYRGTIGDSLLVHFGRVDDYILVQNYLSQEPNATIRSLLQFGLDDFKPPAPPLSLPTLSVLDSLTSTKHKCAAVNWFGDANLINELDNNLADARKHLVRGDSLNCAREVKTFQDKVDKEYQATVESDKKNQPRNKRFVTVEAWKFLYYNAQYILDRLPESK